MRTPHPHSVPIGLLTLRRLSEHKHKQNKESHREGVVAVYNPANT